MDDVLELQLPSDDDKRTLLELKGGIDAAGERMRVAFGCDVQESLSALSTFADTQKNLAVIAGVGSGLDALTKTVNELAEGYGLVQSMNDLARQSGLFQSMNEIAKATLGPTELATAFEQIRREREAFDAQIAAFCGPIVEFEALYQPIVPLVASYEPATPIVSSHDQQQDQLTQKDAEIAAKDARIAELRAEIYAMRAAWAFGGYLYEPPMDPDWFSEN